MTPLRFNSCYSSGIPTLGDSPLSNPQLQPTNQGWKRKMGALVLAGTALVWGASSLSLSAFAQTPSLDVNLSGQQNNSKVPAIPSNAAAIYVDAAKGSDTTGDGSRNAPFQTITHAVGQAASGTVIQLLPGNYTADSGELFPIQLKTGQILRGDESTLGEGFLISGGGTFISPTVARQNVTMLAETGSEIRGISMRNEGRRGYALWLESSAPKVYNNSFVGNVHDGIFMTGDADAWIEGNRFYKNGANGISILGTSSPTVVNNLFQETGFGITIDQKSSPQIRDNRIVQNRSGVVVGGSARPLLRGNLISQNLETGLVAITQAQPDLGTAQDAGNNVFDGNGKFDINNSTKGLLMAANGNQMSGQVKGQVDTNGQTTVQTSAAAAPTVIPEGALSLPSTQVPAAPQPAKPVASNPATGSPASPSTTPTKPLPSPVLAKPTPVAIQPVQPKPTATPVNPVPPQVAANPPSPGSSGQTVEFKPVPFTPDGTPPPSSSSPAVAAAPPAPAAPPKPQLVDITTLIPAGSRKPKPTAPASSTPTLPVTPTAPISKGPTSPPLPAPPATTPSISVPTSPTAVLPQPAGTPVSAPSAPISPTASLPTPAATIAPAPSPVPAAPGTEVATASGTVPAANGSSTAGATQFRVLVTPKTDSDLPKLRQLVPGAVETVFNGRNVLQAGLYDNRNAAQSVLDKLLDAGFEAVAEMMFTQ